MPPRLNLNLLFRAALSVPHVTVIKVVAAPLSDTPTS